ncbi:MAG TPA: VOC family protein [Acidimicrobiales bacterium]|nr:VOC family protein [Acidimicrobiales bacterium]
MKPQLNHTIVAAHDREESATFLAEVMGFDPPEPFGHFLVVEAGNGVSLDFVRADGEFNHQHYAFLVTEAEFDEIFGRIVERELPYWADPMRSMEGEINTHDGGRGVYFADPSGHLLEIITRPYGSGPRAV